MSVAHIDLETGSRTPLPLPDPRRVFSTKVIKTQVLRKAALGDGQDGTTPEAEEEKEGEGGKSAEAERTEVHPLTSILNAVRFAHDQVDNSIKLATMTQNAWTNKDNLLYKDLPISYKLTNVEKTPLPPSAAKARDEAIAAQAGYVLRKRKEAYSDAIASLDAAAKALPMDAQSKKLQAAAIEARKKRCTLASQYRETGHRRADVVPTASDKLVIDVAPYAELAKQILHDPDTEGKGKDVAKFAVGSPRFIALGGVKSTAESGLERDDIAVSESDKNTVLFDIQAVVTVNGKTGSYRRRCADSSSFHARVQHSYISACLFRLLQRYAIPASKLPFSDTSLLEDSISRTLPFGAFKIELVGESEEGMSDESDSGLDYVAQLLLHHAMCVFHAHFHEQSKAAADPDVESGFLPPPDILPWLGKMLGRYVHEEMLRDALKSVEGVESSWTSVPLAGGTTVCLVKFAKSGSVVELWVTSEGVTCCEAEREIVVKDGEEMACFLKVRASRGKK
jgi:hypothetical protein